MRNFRKLNNWIKGIQIAKQLKQIKIQLPDHEKIGPGVQLSKLSVAILSSIIEGYAKSSNKDFGRFLELSQGYSYETEAQLIIADQLYTINTSMIIRKLSEEQNMPASIIKKL